MSTPWTEEDVIVAYALYCITPYGQIKASNKLIQQVAAGFSHSIGSLIMRMQNFAAIDPNLDRKGFGHVAKLDKKIFEEFKHDWGSLSFRAEAITKLSLFNADPINGARPISSLHDHKKVSRERAFFRASVFAAYSNKCCISGVKVPRLLVASHIKPYKKCRDSSERVNPSNGLLLNSFYDKCFDSGLITIDKEYRVRMSSQILKQKDNKFISNNLIAYDNKVIVLPTKFYPEKEFIEYHNDIVFKR